MLYQLSYALKPHYQVSTFGLSNFHLQITTVQSLTRIAFLLKNSRSIWRSLPRKHENRTQRIEPEMACLTQLDIAGNNTSSISGTVNDPCLSCIAIHLPVLHSAARSHLSRTTGSLTWGIHNSSLRLLHDNSAKTSL